MNDKLFSFALFFLLLTAQLSAQTIEMRRLTVTPSTTLNLHPVLSADARHLFFESTFDYNGTGDQSSFHLVNVDLSNNQPVFQQLAKSRASALTSSSDGQAVAFTSTDDLLGENPDGNAEVFFFNGKLLQLTHTQTTASRTEHGCFHPSLDARGEHLVFACDLDLSGSSEAPRNAEIYLYDVQYQKTTKIPAAPTPQNAVNPHLSGDGKTIAYLLTSDLNSPLQQNTLMLFNSTLGERRVIAQAKTLTLPETKALSDDGARVLYVDRDEQGASQLHLFDARWNITRRVTSLAPRKDETEFNACLSGDGRRMAFATRRRPDKAKAGGGVQVYLYDFPSAELLKITETSVSVKTESFVSLNEDGSSLAFNYSRLLSEPSAAPEDAENSEIYLARIPVSPRSAETLEVFHGAIPNKNESYIPALAPSQIAFARGQRLATSVQYAKLLPDETFPTNLGGTTVFVGNHAAQIIYISPTQINFLIPAGVPLGETMVSVKSIDDFEMHGKAEIVRAAPGIFTNDGQESGVLTGAEDAVGASSVNEFFPRWIAYTTGVRGASDVTLQLNGNDLPGKPNLIPSMSLPGLDQLVFEIPPEWRGAGKTTLQIKADGVVSNAVAFEIGAAAEGDLEINEVLADPPNGLTGDANHDGIRDGSDDEFIELVNPTSQDLILTNWTISTRTLAEHKEKVVHRFSSTQLGRGDAVVIFGGGNVDFHDPAFGGALIAKASTGSLGLSNNHGVIMVRDATGKIISEVSYGTPQDSFGGNSINQSFTRSPDAGLNSAGGNFVAHTSLINAASRPYSPGTRSDGTPFNSPPITKIMVTATRSTINVGDDVLLVARAFTTIAGQDAEVKNVSFFWDADHAQPSSLTNRSGPTTTLRQAQAGTTNIRARAGGLESSIAITVKQIVARVEVDPINVSTTVDQSTSVTAIGRDAQGVLIPNLAFDFSLRDESSPGIAILEKTAPNVATLRMKAAGTFKVVAQYINLDGSTIEGTTSIVATAPPAPTVPLPHQLIINEALISFATSTAQPRSDFIELLNTTDLPLDLSGLIVSYRAAGSGSTINTISLPGSVGSATIILMPHDYYLIANSAESFGVKADFNAGSFSLDLNNTSGAIKIEIGQTKLDGLVYQGGASAPPSVFLNFGEGSTFKFNSGTTNDLIRSPNGAASGDNALDFRRQGKGSEVTPRASNPTLAP